MKTGQCLFHLVTCGALFATIATPAPVSRVVFGKYLTEVPYQANSALVAPDADGSTYIAVTITKYISRPAHAGGSYRISYPLIEKIAKDGRTVFAKSLYAGDCPYCSVGGAAGLAVTPAGGAVMAFANSLAGYAPDGNELFRIALPGYVKAISVDASGFIYVTGTALPSAQFQQIIGNPICAPLVYCSRIFFARIAPDGSKVLYSSLIGGSATDTVSAISAGADGSVYLTGVTTSDDFPAFTRIGSRTGVFITHIDASGSRLVYSSIIGGSGSHSVAGLATDADGFAYVTGTTSSQNFPVTDAAYQPQYAGGAGDAFLVKIDLTGAIVFSTYFGSAGDDSAEGVVLDAKGRLLVTLRSIQYGVLEAFLGSSPFRGPLYSKLANRNSTSCDPWNTLLVVNRNSGNVEDFEGLIGFDGFDIVSVAADASGLLHVAGGTAENSPFFNPSDTTFSFDSYLQLVRIDLSRADVFMPWCVVNSASQEFARVSSAPYPTGTYSLTSALSPGELITIYGQGLGPANVVKATGSPLPSQIGDVQVTLGGKPLPLISVSATRIDAVVPYSVPNPASLNLTIRNGNMSVTYPFATGQYAPGIFTSDGTGAGQAAALNDDGTMNSPSNPAARGSIVTLFVTGLGTLSPQPDDASRNPQLPPLPVINGSFSVDLVYGLVWPPLAMPIVYQGLVPGDVPGLYQLSLQIPLSSPTGNLYLLLESVPAPYFALAQRNTTIAVK